MDTQELKKILKDGQELDGKLDYDGTDKIITSHEAKAIYDAHRATIGEGLSCGLSGIMEAIGTFEPGGMTVISGHTGNGKSLLVCSLINDFEAVGRKSLLFSLEMGLSIIKRFKTLPTFYLPKENADFTVQWIRQRIMEAKVKYPGIEAVFIDHLGYVETAEHLVHRNNSLAIGDMVRYLTRAAKEFNVHVFLVAHTKDSKDNRDRAQMEDIRDSGYIIREADNVIMVCRQIEPGSAPDERVFCNYSNLYLDKNRSTGITHKARVQWLPELSIFREA